MNENNSLGTSAEVQSSQSHNLQHKRFMTVSLNLLKRERGGDKKTYEYDRRYAKTNTERKKESHQEMMLFNHKNRYTNTHNSWNRNNRGERKV